MSKEQYNRTKEKNDVVQKYKKEIFYTAGIVNLLIAGGLCFLLNHQIPMGGKV